MWIDIEDAAGNKVGAGPIVTAEYWEYFDDLDRAGRFGFRMPVTDPRSAYVQTKRIARGWGLVKGQVTELGAGIIDRTQVILTRGGQPPGTAPAMLLEVAGSNLLRELGWKTVGNLVIDDGAGGPDTSGPADIMAMAPAWALDTLAGHDHTVKSIAHRFAGETVLQALVRLAELTGEHFRLGTGRQVVWMGKDNPDCGLRAVAAGDPVRLEGNGDICVITDLQEDRDTYDACLGRVYAYGTGNGSLVIDLNGAVVSYPGWTIGNDAKGYYLEHTATWGAYAIESTQYFKDVADQATLVEAAYEWMRPRLAVSCFYRLSVAGAGQRFIPGAHIRVIYRRAVDGFMAVDIDAEMRILEVATHTTEAGPRVIGLRVSSADRWPRRGSEALLLGLQQAHAYYAYSQPINGADHHPAHEHGGSDALNVDGLPGALADVQRSCHQERVLVAGPLAVGASPLRLYNRTGGTLAISQVHLAVGTAPVGADIIVDVHKDGTTIFTNQDHRPVVVDGGVSGQSTDIDVPAWADGDYLTVEIDQGGSGMAGADLVVTVVAA